MPTLSGDLGDLTAQPLTFPNGRPARAWLLPELGYTIVGDELRVGGIELTLDAASAFSQAGVPNGSHRVLVLYYNQEHREPTTVTIPVTVAGDTVLSV